MHRHGPLLESMDNADMRLYQLDSIFGLLLAQPHHYDVVFAGDTNYGDHSVETEFIAAKYPSMVDVGRLLDTGPTFPVQTSVGGLDWTKCTLKIEVTDTLVAEIP